MKGNVMNIQRVMTSLNLQKWYSKNVRRGNLLLNFFAADISGTR